MAPRANAPARAQIRVETNKDGREALLVSFYSAQAAFETAPIAPWLP